MKPYWYATLAALGLLSLYAVTMTLLGGGVASAIAQFRQLWYLMIPLAVGFGIQVGLYAQLRARMKGMMAASGTVSGVGMLACCAHHAADVLPILGLSAAAAVIAQYQKPILLVSLLINGIGIVIMLRHLKKIT